MQTHRADRKQGCSNASFFFRGVENWSGRATPRHSKTRSSFWQVRAAARHVTTISMNFIQRVLRLLYTPLCLSPPTCNHPTSIFQLPRITSAATFKLQRRFPSKTGCSPHMTNISDFLHMFSHTYQVKGAPLAKRTRYLPKTHDTAR